VAAAAKEEPAAAQAALVAGFWPISGSVYFLREGTARCVLE
jgi:hypothetical protein